MPEQSDEKNFLAFPLFPGYRFAQSPSPESSASLLLTHVSLIDATGAPVKPDMTVPVRNHRIVAVSPSSAITHTGRRDIFLPLYIANRVTGVRDRGAFVSYAPLRGASKEAKTQIQGGVIPVMQTTTKAPLFPFGKIVATPRALAALQKVGIGVD